MQKNVLIVVAVAALCAIGGIATLLILQLGSYGIEYDLDGGEFVSVHPESYRPGVDLDIPTPMKDGYISAGFYTDPERTEYFDGNTEGMEGVLKLYARWMESPVGCILTYSQEGECDRGFSSYTLTGTQYKVPYFYSSYSDTLYTNVISHDEYHYTEVQETYRTMGMKIVQSPEYSKCMYQGTEILDTVDGEKVCDKYMMVFDDGAIGTIWVDGSLIYKECYDFIGTSDSDIKSEHITRVLQSVGSVDLPTDGGLSLFMGDGISVSDYKGRYKIGEIVTLTAEVEKGKSFGGWYDADLNLLSDDKKYSFEFYAATSVYLINSMDDRFHFSKNVEVDLDKAFGLDGATYSIHNMDTGSSKSSKSACTFTQSGIYLITTDSVGGNRAYCAEVAGDVTRDYSWKWNGNTYSVSLNIDYEDYIYAKDYYSLSERRQDKPSHDRDKTFVELSCQDARMARYTEKMASLLYDAYMEKNGPSNVKDYLNYLLAFVQYIPYQTDEEYLGYLEYWKFPLETLYDNGGDCEDTSILYAAIALKSMKKLGFDYDVALQIMPGHMCAAIKSSSISGETNPYGYKYCETTSEKYKIGEIPSKMRDYFVNSEHYTAKSFTIVFED